MHKKSITIFFIINWLIYLMQVTGIQGNVVNAVINLKSQYTWYICSSQPTNSIIYNLSVTDGKKFPNPPNFGQQKLGYIYKATSSSMNGVIAAVLNTTSLESYLDPNAKIIYIRAAASCYIQQPEIVAVTDCDINYQWNVYTPLCLAVTNPNKRQIQFQLSLSFDPNVNNVTSESTPTPTSTTASITSSLTKASGSDFPSLTYTPSNAQSTEKTFSDGSRIVSLYERKDLFAISILLIVTLMLF